MEIFLDTANVEDIAFWLEQGLVDGVTTNPSILRSSGQTDVRTAAMTIGALLMDKPLCLEVVSDEPASMLAQARLLAGWLPNVVVKIPIETTTGRPCMDVIHRLAGEGIKVNGTACLSFGQAMLAAKAGAAYVSLFGGRISDEGNHPTRVIEMTVRWLERWDLSTKVIVGSIREAINVQDAAVAGAHVVTVPPKLLRQLADHHYSRATVAQFLEDGRDIQDALESGVLLPAFGEALA